MVFWKKKSAAQDRKQRINDGFRHVDARSRAGSEDSTASTSSRRGRRGSTYHFEPEVILPGITQVPVDRDSQRTQRMPPKQNKRWHEDRPSAGSSTKRSRSRFSSISSRDSYEIFSDRESETSSVSDYSYEYVPPPRRTRSEHTKGKKGPRERVVVTETFVDGKLHKRETETFTYKDSGPSSSSSMDSDGSFEQRFSPNSFRERYGSQRDRRGPDPFRPRSRADKPFQDDPSHSEFRRPPRASTMPRPDPGVRFEYKQPNFGMPPGRWTSPNERRPPPPRWEGPPYGQAPRHPRWDDPPASQEGRDRQYRRQSAPGPRDSSPKPTTSPGGHDATAQELPENVTNKLKPLDEPRWEKASTEALCQYIFRTFPPKTDGPKTYKEQVSGQLGRKDLLKVIARFHPDKNTEHGEEWKLTCSEIAKHLNKRLTDWKEG